MEYIFQDMEIVIKELIEKDFNIAIGNKTNGWAVYISWLHNYKMEHIDYEHKDLSYAVCIAYKKAYECRYGN